MGKESKTRPVARVQWPEPSGHLWEARATLREDGLAIEASSPFGPPRADVVAEVVSSIFATVADPAYAFRALVVHLEGVGFFSATYQRADRTLFVACYHDEASAGAHTRAVQAVLEPHMGPGERAVDDGRWGPR